MCDSCSGGRIVADKLIRETYRYSKLAKERATRECRLFRLSRIQARIDDIELRFCALDEPTKEEIKCMAKRSGIECDDNMIANLEIFAKLYKLRVDGLE